MQNIILSYPNRIDAATITGGSWLPALPAQNLANRELWKVARSTDAALASTKFSVDLGEDRLLRCFALANHNLGPEARWLVKVFGEESPVNLCLYSEQLDNAYWIKFAGGTGTAPVVTPNYATAPDGTLTADRVILDKGAGATSSDQSTIYPPITIITGEPYTFGVWMRSNTAESYAVRIDFNGEGSSDVVNYPNLVTVTPGWQLYLIQTLAASDTTRSPRVRLRGTIGTSDYADISIWGAHMAQSLTLGAYKPTTSAPSNIALLYSSQWLDVWQMAFDNLVEWGSAAWWTGTAGDEYYRSPYPALLAMPDFTTARYVTVEIDDTTNPDGYVQIGRQFAGGGIQPETNASYGLQDSWRDLSTIDASESGSMWATERRRLRGVSFVFDHLTPSESAYIHEMQRLLGTVNEVLYFPYPGDPGESQRYGFIGRLSELSAIEYPYYKRRSNAFKIEEIG